MDNRNKFKYGIYAFLATFALVSTYNIAVVDSEVRVSGIMALLYNLFNGMQSCLSNQGGKITIYFCVIVYLLVKLNYTKTNKSIYFTTVFLALMMTSTKAYKEFGNLTIMFENNFQILKTLLNILGYSVCIYICVKILTLLFESDYDVNPVWKNNKICNIYNKHTFICTWAVILLTWLPHIIIKYPGAMTADNWGQLTQYNGMFPMYSHWPPFHTILLGFFVYTGAAIYSTNIGLFAYVIMQWVVMSAIFSYTLTFMKQCGTKRIYRVCILMIYCLSPVYAGFVGVVEKDVLYSAFFVLYLLEIMKLLLNNRLGGMTRKDVALLILSAIMVGLMRKNGIYIITLTAMFFAIKSIVNAFLTKKLKCITVGIAFVIPIIIVIMINTFIEDKYDMRPGSIAEALSLPIQQTARYIRTYPDDLSDEEKEVLNIVFENYEEMGSRYDSNISDPVKSMFNDDVTNEQIMDYFKVWIRLFFRHPLVYFEATFAQNYYIFDIDTDSYSYYRDFHGCKGYRMLSLYFIKCSINFLLLG
jgi:hypothetical protein